MIRPFKKKDLEAVKDVFNENVPKYFASEEVNDLLVYLAEYGNTYFVIEKNHQILGCGGYHLPEKGLARLSWDFFRKEAKGKGLGRKLIQHCLDEIESLDDISEIQVWTSQYAQGFYAKFEFKTVNIEADYWADGLDLYLMKRS